MYLKNKPTDQQQMITSYLKKLGQDESKTKVLKDYLSEKLKQFIGRLSINSVTAECSLYVINQSFEKQRIDEVYMLLAIIFHLNWETLMNKKNNRLSCDYIIIKNCEMNLYRDKFTKLAEVNVSVYASLRVKSNLREIVGMDFE
jgi:hypothetical protein